jgi:hypothetical protein
VSEQQRGILTLANKTACGLSENKPIGGKNMMKKTEEQIQKEAEAAYEKMPEKQLVFSGVSEAHWRRIATEFRHAPSTMGSFHFHLCEAIVRADLAETERLKKAYPELVHWIQDVDM